MKTISLKYILLIVSTLFSVGMLAQQKHEVSVYGMGGFSMLNAEFNTPFSIKDKGSFGGGLGAHYAYNLNEKFAILSGLELQLNKSKIEANKINGNYMIEDYLHGDQARFDYKVSNYSEDIKYSYLNIPIMVRYTHGLSEKVGLYASAGAKIGFNVKATYDNSFGKMATSATYGSLGNGEEDPVINDLPNLGFGVYENGSSDGDVSMKTAISSAIELGMKYKVRENRALYVGMYFDYTLNNVWEQGGQLFVEYNQHNPSKVGNGSIAGSYNKDKNETTIMTRSFRPMHVGLKVQLSFSL